MEISSEELTGQRIFLLHQLSDPLLSNKTGIIEQIHALNVQLLDRQKITYFCSLCHFHHARGQIYLDHKQYAELPINFPPIEVPYCEFHFSQKVVGIYGLKSENICQKIPKNASIHFKHDLEKNTLILYYGRRKIGYLANYFVSTHRTFFNPIQNRISINWEEFSPVQSKILDHKMRFCRICHRRRSAQCNQANCRQRHFAIQSRFFKAAYGRVKIDIIMYKRLELFLLGLMDLGQLGHPDIANPVRCISSNLLPIIFQILNSSRNPWANNLLQLILLRKGISISSGFQII